jgi:hypothetical protein
LSGEPFLRHSVFSLSLLGEGRVREIGIDWHASGVPVAALDEPAY